MLEFKICVLVARSTAAISMYGLTFTPRKSSNVLCRQRLVPYTEYTCICITLHTHAGGIVWLFSTDAHMPRSPTRASTKHEYGPTNWYFIRHAVHICCSRILLKYR